MTYADAMLRYGSDKPDLRFGLEIEDATELTRDSQFKVFAGAPAVRYITVPQEYSRADLEKLEEYAKEWGAKGLAYIVYGEDGEARSPIAKFLSEEELAAFRADPGSTVLFGADEPEQVARVLGALRSQPRARARPRRRGGVSLGLGHGLPDVRVVGGGAGLGRRPPSVHAPGSGFGGDAREGSRSRDRPRVRPIANGEELGGGSVRIHESELQAKVFDILRISPEQQRDRFGFLLDALKMGAPPHGGIAFGIDRMVMVLAREPNLRDTVAFPKNQAGFDPMSGAPSDVLTEQLDELGIQVKPQKKPESDPG